MWKPAVLPSSLSLQERHPFPEVLALLPAQQRSRFISLTQLFPSQICDAPAEFPFNSVNLLENTCGNCKHTHTFADFDSALPASRQGDSSTLCYVHRNMRRKYRVVSSLSSRILLQEWNRTLLLAPQEPFKTCCVTGGFHISAAAVCLFRQQRQTCGPINVWPLLVTVLEVRWTKLWMNRCMRFTSGSNVPTCPLPLGPGGKCQNIAEECKTNC